MFSVTKLFRYIWPQIRKYKGAFYGILVFYAMRVAFGAILVPFYFKKIIDTLSFPGTERALVASGIFKLVFIIIGLNLIAILLARGVKFLYITFTINMIRELRNFVFQKI